MVLQDAPRLPVTLHLRPDYGRTAFLQNVCSPLLPSTTSRGRESYIHHEHTGIRSAMRSLPKATAASNAGAARKSRGRAAAGCVGHTPLGWPLAQAARMEAAGVELTANLRTRPLQPLPPRATGPRGGGLQPREQERPSRAGRPRVGADCLGA